jgi:bacteriorhodopsin
MIGFFEGLFGILKYPFYIIGSIYVIVALIVVIRDIFFNKKD